MDTESKTISKPETTVNAATMQPTIEKILPQVYVKITNAAKNGEPSLKLVTYPNQGFVANFIECDTLPGKDGDVFLVDILENADTKVWNAVSAFTKQPGVPNQVAIDGVKANVEAALAKYESMEKEIAEKAKAEFFDKNKIPAIPKDLVIDEAVWKTICASIGFDIPVMLLGPKGCGKTQTAKELAKALGYKFAMFNMGSAFKPKELFVGQVHAKENANGVVETTLVPSQFLTLFQSDEPVLIFLDEATRTPAAATNYLMTVIDSNQNEIYVPELGKSIKRGKGVRFIAAGNAGMQYTDTRTMDGAFWDRFQKFLVDYLDPKDELALLMYRVPNANAKIMKELIERANKCRTQEKSGDLTTGISTRQLLNMAQFISVGFTLDEVFTNVFLTNFVNGNNNEMEQVKALIQG